MADVKKKKTPPKGGNGALPRKADKGKNGKKDEGKPSFAYQLIPYILGVLALLLMICFVANLFCNPNDILGQEGRRSEHALGYFGYWVCNVFMGLFGPAAFAIPVILALFTIFWKNYNRRSYVAINSVIAFLSSIVVSALIHTFIHMGAGKEGFSYVAGELYNEGAKLSGGGFVGGYAAYGLVAILNIFGTIFMLIVVLIPMILFLCGTTPVEVVQKIAAKAKDAAEERKEIAAEDKAHEKEQARLDRAAEREQDKLDREAEREARRAEREEARAAAIAEREAAKNQPDDEEDDEDEDVVLSVPQDMKKGKDSVVVKINAPEEALKAADDLQASGEKTDGNVEAENDDEDVLSVASLPNESLIHDDGIKAPSNNTQSEGVNGEEPDESDDEDENDGETLNFTTVVFDDPKADNKQRGHGTVDDLFNERFSDEMVVDKTTGEVFTPVAGDAKAKSADEFRAQNENKDEHFIGDKPEPITIPEYKFPPADLLQMGPTHYASDPEEVKNNAELLKGVLEDFRIPIKEITCSCGPTLTRYEIKPEAGVRVRQIANLVDDISMTLAKSGVRIEAPIPGKAAVGIEVPNDKPAAVKLRNLIENPEFTEHKSKLASCLGADVSGNPVVFDIEKMPHLLVAGTTGSGKSVCINSIIMSIMYHARPDEVKLLLIDPKQVEFQIYRDIPHLCCRIISNPKKAAGALNTAVNEMEKRFELIREVGVRNIAGYNEVTKNDPEKPYMPRLVIIIDEFADLMMTAKDEVETAVVRIAQKARAAGIHLIIGTQRPSVDVITGLIKANIPSRIAFTVMSGVDSRTILDTVGAEKLCGRGDMLYAPVGAQKPQRVQGAFVSDGEVEAVVEYVKANNHPVIYDQEFESSIENEATSIGSSSSGGSGGEINVGAGDDDSLLFAAAELAIDSGKIATSMLQRRLSVGYGRAAKIIDRLEEMGVVGPPDGTKPRQVLMSREDFMALKESMSG